jgi:very-short-patch-repair endonuclease
MQKRADLPDSLASAPFTLGSAKASGVPPNRLRRADVAHVSRELYRPTGWSFELEAAARALSAASPGAWISHVTAARIRSQILPAWLADSTELHLSKPHSLPDSVLASEDEIEFVDGIRISSRSRTWLDMARRLSESELVCMGDELIRVPRAEFEDRTEPFDTLEGLRSLVARHPNLQGVVRARAALERMRVGADSAPESLLRLAMEDAGLPEPQLQVPLRESQTIGPTADLGYRQRRLAIQYDGGHHLLEPQVFSDRRRDKAFEAAGWTVVVFGKKDLADGFEQAIRLIKRAMRTSQLDHPQASGFADAV